MVRSDFKWLLLIRHRPWRELKVHYLKRDNHKEDSDE